MISKFLLACSFILSIPAAAMCQEINHANLDTYKWKNRLLLVFSSSHSSADYLLQLNKLEGEKAGLKDRDLKIFHLTDDGDASVEGKAIPDAEVQRLAKKYDVDLGVFTVILFGKDGTEKLRESAPVQVEKLFSTIDAMPMRQQEMEDNQ